MQKKFAIILMFLSMSIPVLAQQDPMYSQYVFNGMLINPAYAGSREVLVATALYRNQWTGIPGAPKTGVFSLDAPVKDQKVGLGMNVIFDKIGVTSHTEISGIYSYRLNFTGSALTFGLQAGAGFYSSSNSTVKYSDESMNDPAFAEDYHRVLPTLSTGLYYRTDRFFTGFSVMDLMGGVIQDQIYPEMANDLNINVVSHFFLNSGYLFDFSPDVRFQPSLLLKYVGGAPLEADLNGVIMLYDLLAFGASYRTNASLDFLMQVKVNKQISLGYSYEYSTNELSNYTSGSHEVVLRYQFDFSHGKVQTPRFF